MPVRKIITVMTGIMEIIAGSMRKGTTKVVVAGADSAVVTGGMISTAAKFPFTKSGRYGIFLRK